LEGAYSSRVDFYGSFVFIDTGLGIVGFQDADLAGARLDATDLASVDFRRATGNVNVSLADLRGAFSSQQSADTTQDMPGGFAGTPPIACQRNTQPTPPRSSLDFFARQSVLASDPPDPALANLAPADPALADPALADPALAVPALANHPDWLITTPSPAYVQALSDYLVGELAPSDPAAAQGIARRMALSIYDDETRPIAEPIACRLLATPALKLTKQSVDVLNTALKQAKITCPAAAVPAAPQ
jgi:hypothetical protein